MASCGHDGGGLTMRSMSRSPPRKAAQVGSLEMAVVAGTCECPTFLRHKVGQQKVGHSANFGQPGAAAPWIVEKVALILQSSGFV